MINESKIYQSGQEKIYANDQVNFEIEKGELAVILGSSGAGKSTVLNILGGMDTNDEGEVIIDEEKISNFSNKELITYRRYAVGFVFQFYNLVNNLTSINVILSLLFVVNVLVNYIIITFYFLFKSSSFLIKKLLTEILSVIFCLFPS